MINYKYYLRLSVMDVDGTISVYDNKLSFVTILDDYANSVNSAIKIGFFVNPTMYNNLELRATQMEYSLSVYAMENSPLQFTNSAYSETFLEGLRLIPINVPTTAAKTDSNTNNNNKTDYIQVVMDFVPLSVLKYNRYMFNGIYNNVTVNDVILYLLNKLDMNVLYEVPDNTTRYEQIVLPPNNLFMSLKFLQQHYGIYNNGITTYFKGGLFLVKNRYNRSTTPKFSPKHVNIARIVASKNISEYKGMFGEYTELDTLTNTYNYRTTLDKISIANNKISIEELYGNKHMVYSSNLEDGTYCEDSEFSYKQNADKLKLYHNFIENPTAVNQYFTALKNPTTITVDYTNSSLDMWNPLNRFRLHIQSDDTLYDRYINHYFQVAQNQMFFAVNSGIATLEGKVKLIDIGGI